MPIRIWNTPGGPVRYGEDWTDLYDTLSEEEKKRLGLEQTELGRWVSKEEVGYGTGGPGINPDEWGDSMRGAALDMTSPRNRAAKAGVLSRGAKMPLYTDIQGVELDPMMREAQRLSTPWRGTQTLEIEPTLEEKLSGSRIHPKTYEISGEAMPAASELEMSSKIWQASQRPLATMAGEAETEKDFAEAESKRAEAGLYGAQAKAAEARIGEESSSEITAKTNQLKMYAQLLQTAVKEGKISLNDAQKRLDDMRKMLFGGEVQSLTPEPSGGPQADLGGLDWDKVVEKLGPR